MVTDLLDEFNHLWEKSSNIDEVIKEYESVYNHAKQFTDFRK